MSSQPNKSIIDGITCLQTLASSSEPIGVRELARQLDLQPMKANRVLMTLMSMGLVTQNEKKAYMPGPGIHVLAAQAIHGSTLLSKALPVIEEQLPCDHIISIGVLWGDKVSYLVHAEPNQSFSQSIIHNHLYDASKSTIGLLLLSRMQDEKVMAILGDQKFEKIKDKLSFAREHGYSKQHHTDPLEVTIAIPLDEKSDVAIAFSRFKNSSPNSVPLKLEALKKLGNQINGETT
ncbi:helix-turn-helix domain-containing protein [Vibrio hannami]|uniref:helix-turn-helix domain-containing protein n=1 Tax=Vibrio hannami TaxID=2717094 RepID=UPI00241048FB|nr:helix-turn-helix domain-containing protein [Vibrio hannami]MDG3085370.1 helix-turn-helix domain-containing protein [Vibrio hannami]